MSFQIVSFKNNTRLRKFFFNFFFFSFVFNNTSIENFFKQKYVVLSNGHLYISNVDQDDLQKRFRCQVVNEFTGERIDSINWARLKLMSKLKLFKFFVINFLKFILTFTFISFYFLTNFVPIAFN